MFGRSVVVFATFVAVAESQLSPAECILDTGLGAYGLLYARRAMRRAVSNCGDPAKRAECASDIGSVVRGLGAASGHLAEAAASCGRRPRPRECVVDISFALSDAGNAVRLGGVAATKCSSGQIALCVADVFRMGTSVALAVHHIEDAVTSCRVAALPSPATPCEASLATLTRSIGDAFPPHNTSTFVPSYVNATTAACGSCFDDAALSRYSAAGNWEDALQTLVQSGARCQ